MGDENTLAGTTKAHKHSATSSDGGFLETTTTGITNLSEGSIVYGDASEIVTELTAGSDGDLMTISSGLPAWSGTAVGLPAGSLVMWCGLYDSIPTGWLLCDGSEINRTTYADLFSAMGTQFGSTGATTFTLPLFQNIFPRSPASSTSCGATGGSDTVSLTEAELASHSHTASVTDPGHNHTSERWTGTASYNASLDRASSGVRYDNTPPTGTSTTGVTVANDNTGSGTAHENKPAYLEVLYIVKI